MDTEERRNRVARLEMFVRFTDGTGREMHSVEDTLENRRTLDRMASHLLAKSTVESIAVEPVVGRSAGFARSRGSYR